MAKEIPLTRGYIAVVDDDDFESLSKHRWYFQAGYAKRGKKVEGRVNAKVVPMHREILGMLPGDERVVDHIDGDGLNNRRSNLRICTVHENNRNRRLPRINKCGYKGVRKSSNGKWWYAQIGAFGKVIHLGQFNTPEEAHQAYCRAADELHGQFANHGSKK